MPRYLEVAAEANIIAKELLTYIVAESDKGGIGTVEAGGEE